MSIDVTDPEFAAKLAAARETGDVWGPDGQLLGQFVPLSRMDLPQLDDATVAEMDRRRTDPNAVFYTADEVMARLREISTCGR